MIEGLGQAGVLGRTLADVAVVREGARRKRLRRVASLLVVIGGYAWFRVLTGDPIGFGLPTIGPDAMIWLPGAFLVTALIAMICVPMLVAGRSPHVLYRSSEIDTTLDDVRGAGIVKDEVVRTLNLFLAYKTFKETMGGTPRRAILSMAAKAITAQTAACVYCAPFSLTPGIYAFI